MTIRHLTEEHKRKIGIANKGHKYNFGKHHSEETKKKLKEARRRRKEKFGYLNSMETREKISKAKQGNIVTEETKKKISKTLKGRIFSKDTLMKMSLAVKGKPKPWLKGKPRSEEIKKQLSISHMGSKNHLWKGGISPVVMRIRMSLKYKQWRQQIFIRDNFTCQKCGTQGGALQGHHIKPFVKLLKEVKEYLPLMDLYEAAMIYTPLWETDNGTTYCKKCHDLLKKKGGTI